MKKSLYRHIKLLEKNKKNEGITLIALVITIVILILLSAITIGLVFGEDGLIEKTKTGSKEYSKEAAVEKMNLKITSAQINKYAEEQRMPTLEEFALILETDDDIQYVNGSRTIASTADINFTTVSSIYTKLKAYPYEFEIDKQLRLASIDGVRVAEETSELDALKAEIKAELKSELKSEIKAEIKAELQAELVGSQLDGNPVGTIIAFSANTVPDENYLKCEGQEVSRETYSELFAVIGTSYGEGNGSTTFCVPDLRGEFLRGTGTNSHTNQGDGQTVGQHRDATGVPHIYTYRNKAGTGYGIGFRYDTTLEKDTAGSIITNADKTVKSGSTVRIAYVASDSQSTTNSSTTGLEYSVRPTNTAVLYLIKAK